MGAGTVVKKGDRHTSWREYGCVGPDPQGTTLSQDTNLEGSGPRSTDIGCPGVSVTVVSNCDCLYPTGDCTPIKKSV